MVQLPRVWIQSLVEELRSYKLLSVAPLKKIQIINSESYSVLFLKIVLHTFNPLCSFLNEM